MTRPAQPTPAGAPPREGNLDEVGAVLCAIRSLTSGSGGLDEEETRAVYALSCIALNEWRLMDAAADSIGAKR